MPKQKQDVAQWGHSIMQQVIAKAEGVNMPGAVVEHKFSAGKNPAAVALGRLGGLKGGKARVAATTKAQRQEIGRKGAEKRWRKKD